MTTNVCCLNLFTGLYFIYRVVKYIFSFSLVDTYKSRLTFAFLLKFFEIQYFKWYIMVNWNFREGIWPQLDDGRSGLPPSDYYDGDGSQGPYSYKKRRLKKDWKLSLVIVPLETIRACTCARVHTHTHIYIYILQIRLLIRTRFFVQMGNALNSFFFLGSGTRYITIASTTRDIWLFYQSSKIVSKNLRIQCC